MSLFKKAKDSLIKALWGRSIAPQGLVELNKYFRIYEPINFRYEKNDGLTIAVSTNFHCGSIIASGKNQDELDKNIKDAILTSFEVPSSYAKESGVQRVGEKKTEYALA